MSEPRTSDSEPRLERRSPPCFALFFYGFPAAAAWVLLFNTYPGRSAELWTPSDLPLSVGFGAGLAAVLLLVRWIGLRTLPVARGLEAEFGWIVGKQRKWECLMLAVLSALAEEFLFRGWLQTTIGLWPAAVGFGVLHWPVNRNFLPWPIFAFAAGLAFGYVTEWTGDLTAAVMAHAVYNGTALWRVTDRFADWDQDRVDRFVKTGKFA